ncbi:MAG: radical SAM protein [Oscillospiraceae bacterium]|nr:radical SAM protein [Oscillospiraceae bacterium]
MKIRLADIVDDSIVDGPGFRMTIFVQGCSRICPGCHNPGTHDPNGGYDYSCDEILARAKRNPLLRGLTFSGGEPFMQAEACSYLAGAAAKTGLDIMTYTGYTYEELLAGADSENHWFDLLSNTNILVDGPYDEALRTLDEPFRGSKNQRAIDVKASLARGEVTLFEFS